MSNIDELPLRPPASLNTLAELVQSRGIDPMGNMALALDCAEALPRVRDALVEMETKWRGPHYQSCMGPCICDKCTCADALRSLIHHVNLRK